MKKFLLKFILFLAFVFIGQVLIPLSRDIPNEIKLLDFFMKYNASIIYFGDSTINWAAQSDLNQESMPGLLQQLLPRTRIIKITHASYQMEVYQSYAQYIVRKKYHPRAVIIPINLRSFSPEWDQQPLWQFEKERLTLAMKDTFWMKFYRPLCVFKFFEPQITRFKYEQTKVFDGPRFLGRVRDFDHVSYRDFSEQNMKNKLLFRYMYPLTNEHPKVQALIRTAGLFKSHNIEAIFYLTPIDWQTIEKYLGADHLARISEHATLIKNVLAEQGVELLDLSRALATEDFCWPQDGTGPFYPNEHLKLRGRMFVVKSLVERTALGHFE